MAFKIGFMANQNESNTQAKTETRTESIPKVRKSIVEVEFPESALKLSYLNDKFDLHPSDLVYVEGKFEGRLGRVRSVNYSFKVKLSDYKRVIGVVDTSVAGTLFMAGTHFVAFERGVLPKRKISSWFFAPVKEDDVYISGEGDSSSSFSLSDISKMDISAAAAERGHECYLKNKVKYIEISDTRGYAIVEGSKNYEIEFEYKNTAISNLSCSCFCTDHCKHEFAVMLQLKEMLNFIEDNYKNCPEHSKYFATISKDTLINFSLYNNKTGIITL